MPNYPVFSLDLAPPGQMTAPMIVGASIEGGRSQSGVTSAADISGGGIVTVKYSSVGLDNADPAAMKYWSSLGAMLNGGQRSILVPMLTDFYAPRAGDLPLYLNVPFSDGAPFDDDASWQQTSIPATTATAAALNAGTLTITMDAPGQLFGGEWFEIAHATKSSRVYCIREIDSSIQNGDGSTTYTVGIRPTLRQAVEDATPLKFDRPRCLMRLAPGSSISMEIQPAWISRPDVTFVESFPY